MTPHRYWIRFAPSVDKPLPMGLNRGCGVTAFDQQDALDLIRQYIFQGEPLPNIQELVEDVDVSELDASHVRPNMGSPLVRGIWFPQGYTSFAT
jgi:hypothetical protein